MEEARLLISKTSVPSVRLSRGHAAQCEDKAPPDAVNAMQQFSLSCVPAQLRGQRGVDKPSSAMWLGRAGHFQIHRQPDHINGYIVSVSSVQLPPENPKGLMPTEFDPAAPLSWPPAAISEGSRTQLRTPTESSRPGSVPASATRGPSDPFSTPPSPSPALVKARGGCEGWAEGPQGRPPRGRGASARETCHSGRVGTVPHGRPAAE